MYSNPTAVPDGILKHSDMSKVIQHSVFVAISDASMPWDMGIVLTRAHQFGVKFGC